MSQPLAGIRVLDLGRVYQGPYAGFLLASAGADVVKVESPAGDPVRGRPGRGGYPFELLNASKRGIMLDLKTPDDVDTLRRLAARADVLIENFVPGVMERLGLGVDALHAINPRLVYASASGYGRSGPRAQEMAMDLTIQAESGIMSVTGHPDGPPLKSNAGVSDFLGGTHLYGGIVTALYERERTGRGRLVEISMLEASLPALASSFGWMLADADSPPPRTANQHAALDVVPYNAYQASDGWVVVICVTPPHWTSLAALIGGDLTDARYADPGERVQARAEIDDRIAAWAEHRTRDEILDELRHHGVPGARVRTVPEAIDDEQLRLRSSVVAVNHPRHGTLRLLGSAIRYDGEQPVAPTPAPALDEHRDAVLADWGAD